MTGVVALYGPPRGRFRSRRGWPEPFRLFAVGLSATPTKDRPMRSLSLQAGVAATAVLAAERQGEVPPVLRGVPEESPKA